MRIEYILIALAFVSVVVEAVVLYRLDRENRALEFKNQWLEDKLESGEKYGKKNKRQ